MNFLKEKSACFLFMHSHIYDIAILTDLYTMIIFQRNWETM